MNTTQTQLSEATKDLYGHDQVEMWGVREHNLKNIDVTFPRNQLVVITGISGSGKSSLAFDTLYAEGQRRYMESFAAYARNFIGNMGRPDVDKINGLSPVIAIEQKTTTHNSRSTVGTTTEIYDFLRLLFARIAEAYSYLSGEKMTKQTNEQIQDYIFQAFKGRYITLLAPLVKGRKGHYQELFQQLSQRGFSKVRVDGVVERLYPKMQVSRYQTHDIELVIDHLLVDNADQQRLQHSLTTAWKQAKGETIMVQDDEKGVHYFSKALMEIATGISYEEPAPNTFSFNSPYGACTTCNGLGELNQVDINALIPNKELSISQGGITPLGSQKNTFTFHIVEAMLKKYQSSICTPIKDLSPTVLQAILYGDGSKLSTSPVKHPQRTFNATFEGIIPLLIRQTERARSRGKTLAETFEHKAVCPDCQGTRLKKEALHFKIAGYNIAEMAAMDMPQLYHWVNTLANKLSSQQQLIAKEVLKEVQKRIRFLLDVGLPYLHLNRPLKTLSGGETQRIRLATQIGTQLVGVLYIMDEPSIGLHPRDNMRLIYSLQALRDLGNSIVVVEHDKSMMMHADYILEIGPGAGRHGGYLVNAGSFTNFLKKESATALFLSGKEQIPIPPRRRKGNGQYLIMKGCCGNNLKNIELHIPLGTLVGITGVSGSGKSTLIHGTLSPALQRHLHNAHTIPLSYSSAEGLNNFDKVIEIDQAPIGRTPRSNPATYTGIFAEIRMLFTQLPESKIRGYSPGRFSFNVKGGRCETCEGAGMKVIEMDFLPALRVPCETCQGKRYNRETLEVRYRGKAISDVLKMSVDDAVTFFAHYPAIFSKVKTLAEIGLGYITLGQHATTLSGGEAQRVKLATELTKKNTGKTLYILDEPTTGLHFRDIQHLLEILNRLVDKGNTVLVVEHNIDLIKVADYVIDMGPEGGQKGGEIVVEGTPEVVAQHPNSYTGTFLKEELREIGTGIWSTEKDCGDSST